MKNNGIEKDGMNNDKNNLVIVIPMGSMPPEGFLDSLPQRVPMIVIDDSNGKLALDKNRFELYDYKKQSQILGKNYKYFENFHHSSACRNLGHYLAYRAGFEYIISLDYDCQVYQDFLSDHLAPLKTKQITGITSKNEWINPLFSNDWYTRGYPYEFRTTEYKYSVREIKKPRIVLNMGLWDNVIDINGIDKVLAVPPKTITLKKKHLAALKSMPICGMNNSFLKEAIPAYFFLPNFKVGNWTVSRHDDIWGGYIFQKIAFKKGDLVSFGGPVVRHLRESSQPHVLYYEHFMHMLNRYFYDLVDESVEKIDKSDYKSMYAEFVEEFGASLSRKEKNLPKTYFDGFKYLHKSMLWWVTLFKKP